MIKRALACSRRSSARASSVRFVASKRPDRLQGAADPAFLVVCVPFPLSLTDTAFSTFRRPRQALRCFLRWCGRRSLPDQFPPCSSRESCARQVSIRDATSRAISASSSSAGERFLSEDHVLQSDARQGAVRPAGAKVAQAGRVKPLKERARHEKRRAPVPLNPRGNDVECGLPAGRFAYFIQMNRGNANLIAAEEQRGIPAFPSSTFPQVTGSRASFSNCTVSGVVPKSVASTTAAVLLHARLSSSCEGRGRFTGPR